MVFNGRPATPWHLWAIGIVALIFYGGGAYNYLMMQTANAAYLESYTPQQLAYFETAPVWFHAAWAIGVWTPLVGALLLLARSRFAFVGLFVGLVGFVIATFYQFAAPAPESMTSGVGLVSTLMLGAFQLFFVIYSFIMLKKGVLA